MMGAQQNQHSHALWFLSPWAANKQGSLWRYEVGKDTRLEYKCSVGATGNLIKQKTPDGFVAISPQMEGWFCKEIDSPAKTPIEKLVNGDQLDKEERLKVTNYLVFQFLRSKQGEKYLNGQIQTLREDKKERRRLFSFMEDSKKPGYLPANESQYDEILKQAQDGNWEYVKIKDWLMRYNIAESHVLQNARQIFYRQWTVIHDLSDIVIPQNFNFGKDALIPLSPSDILIIREKCFKVPPVTTHKNEISG